VARDAWPVIAIVDDDQAVRESLCFLLGVAGHAVRTFASAGEFLDAGPEQFHLLIVDYQMPKMTGLDLAERLRAGGVNIPILLVTASPSDSLVDRAAQLGIGKVLEKPCSYEDLHPFIYSS